MKKIAPKKNKVIGFDDLNNKLDRVIAAMATKDDLADGLHALETRLEQKIDAVDEKHTKKFQEILVATDGLMKPLSELKMEYTGMMIQLSRHEEWIKLIATKTDVALH